VLASITEIVVDARAPVRLLALVEARPNEHAEATILDAAPRLVPFPVRVQAASRHAEHSTDSSDGKGLLLDGEREPHALSFAKKAAAYSAGHRNAR
jgi:hypothetical protein